MSFRELLEEFSPGGAAEPGNETQTRPKKSALAPVLIIAAVVALLLMFGYEVAIVCGVIMYLGVGLFALLKRPAPPSRYQGSARALRVNSAESREKSE